MGRLSTTLLLILFTQLSWAFSGFGHQTVCELAYLKLDSQRQAWIDQLMQSQNWSNYGEACRWPDSSDAEPKARKALGTHFINLPRQQTQVNSEDCQGADHCLFSAIREDQAVLLGQYNAQSKAQALAYLGHWVGDLHQPLHVSFADDLGGNKVTVKGSDLCTNLHGLWDYCLVQWQASRRGMADSAQAYASWLMENYPSEPVGTPQEWANESYQISRDLTTGYCLELGCQLGANEIRVTPDYFDTQGQVIEARLAIAGHRLAALLTQVLTEQSRQVGEIKTRSGHLDWIIILLLCLPFFRTWHRLGLRQYW